LPLAPPQEKSIIRRERDSSDDHVINEDVTSVYHLTVTHSGGDYKGGVTYGPGDNFQLQGAITAANKFLGGTSADPKADSVITDTCRVWTYAKRYSSLSSHMEM
jgi:hypothetical protein